MTKREKDLLVLAKARFKQGQEAFKAQNERETDDLKFYAGDQWPADIKAARAGQDASGMLPPVPARPCITINKTRQPVRQVLNQERQSDIGLQIVPADDFGSGTPVNEEEIELREGLTRKIQRDSRAGDARTWAFSRAAIAGRGYYGVMTRYLPGATFDQEIYIRRFFDQRSITLDPVHEEPDGSDATWGFVASYMGQAEYDSLYPFAADGKKNAYCECTEADFKAANEQSPDWFTYEGGADGAERTRIYRVVEYWYLEHTAVEYVQLGDGTVVEKSKAPTGAEIIAERRDTLKQVKFCKLDGAQILEETDWPGKYIPIIKVLGEELHPYDKERRIEGMVRPMIEPGQGFNYMISKEVETIGLTPIPQIMMAEGQAEGYETWYQSANTRTLPYLYYRQTDAEGRPAPPPFRAPIDTQIQPIAMALQQFSEALKDVSAVPSTAMGEVDPGVKSGRAIRALIDRATQGTSNYLDNLARSVNYEGRIINDLLYPIYGQRPGRLAQMLNGENKPESVLVGQPFVKQGKRVQPAQPGQQGAKTYQLTDRDDWNVAIKVTKSYETRREQQFSETGEMIAAMPGLMSVIGDLYFQNSDGPGSQEMAKRVKATLDPKVLAVIDEKQPIPPEAQQQMAQMAQMLDAMGKELQQKNQIIETEAVKAQQSYAETQLQQQMENARKAAEIEARASVERMKTEAQERQSALDNLVKLAIAEIGQQTALSDTHAEQVRQEMGYGHEHVENERDRAVQMTEAERDRQAQSRESAESRAFQSSESAEDRAAAERQAKAKQDAGGTR